MHIAGGFKSVSVRSHHGQQAWGENATRTWEAFKKGLVLVLGEDIGQSAVELPDGLDQGPHLDDGGPHGQAEAGHNGGVGGERLGVPDLLNSFFNARPAPAPVAVIELSQRVGPDTPDSGQRRPAEQKITGLNRVESSGPV